MVISEDSQLGLRFKKTEVKIDFLDLMKGYLNKEITLLQSLMDSPAFANIQDVLFEDLKNKVISKEIDVSDEQGEYLIKGSIFSDQIKDEITKGVGNVSIVGDEESKYFLIRESVYKAAELIKIGENFTGRTMKDISLGKYTYLMGKHQMVRFFVAVGFIKGFYFDSKSKKAFEFGIKLETGEYYFQNNFDKEFSTVMQILTFVELGDIEVKILKPLQKVKAEKKENDIYNANTNTVFVVDSSWNQLLIRTEGFAVRGHFRLQPCGEGMADRKLIWINAFEKDGYTRKPKASIIK
jgi:hypothetical protein